MAQPANPIPRLHCPYRLAALQIDTEGKMAIDQFYVTYHGEPLPQPMVLLLTNSLQYQLALVEVGKEESY